MSNMTFQDYCDDILDQHIGLMSEEELQKAIASYKNWMAPKEKIENHPDSKLKLNDLKAKVERLLASQKIAVVRAAGKDVALVEAFIVQAEEALSRKAKKSELLALITLSSDASRNLTQQA